MKEDWTKIHKLSPSQNLTLFLIKNAALIMNYSKNNSKTNFFKAKYKQ